MSGNREFTIPGEDESGPFTVTIPDSKTGRRILRANAPWAFGLILALLAVSQFVAGSANN